MNIKRWLIICVVNWDGIFKRSQFDIENNWIPTQEEVKHLQYINKNFLLSEQEWQLAIMKTSNLGNEYLEKITWVALLNWFPGRSTFSRPQLSVNLFKSKLRWSNTGWLIVIDAGSAGVCWINFKSLRACSRETTSQKRHGAYFAARNQLVDFIWLMQLPVWVTSCGDSMKISLLLKYCFCQMYDICESSNIVFQHETSVIFDCASIQSVGLIFESENEKIIFGTWSSNSRKRPLSILKPWSKKNFNEWSMVDGANFSKIISDNRRSLAVRGVVYSHQSLIGCARPKICFV